MNEGLKALTDAVDNYGHEHEFTKLVPRYMNEFMLMSTSD